MNNGDLVVVSTGIDKLVGTFMGIAGNVVKLSNARRLMVTMAQKTNSRGEIEGLKIDGLILPIDLMTGPVPVIEVVYGYLYSLADDPSSLKRLETMIKVSESNEQRLRAAESGIVLPRG